MALTEGNLSIELGFTVKLSVDYVFVLVGIFTANFNHIGCCIFIAVTNPWALDHCWSCVIIAVTDLWPVNRCWSGVIIGVTDPWPVNRCWSGVIIGVTNPWPVNNFWSCVIIGVTNLQPVIHCWSCAIIAVTNLQQHCFFFTLCHFGFVIQSIYFTDGLTASPIKGILKKVVGAGSAVGAASEDGGGLLCNVPEHHDLVSD